MKFRTGSAESSFTPKILITFTCDTNQINMTSFRIILAGFIILFSACQSEKNSNQSTESKPDVVVTTESAEDFDNRMEWWRDAGFGMFIHWGPYAVPAGEYKGETVKGVSEWIMNTAQIPIAEYESYSAAFNPTQFDAEEWAKIAYDAGMKYIVITSKHHDGFSLWDSKVTDYDVMDFAPIKRDLLAELKEACDRYDIKLCFYYSIMDWHHPDAQAPHYPTYNTGEKSNPRFTEYYENYMKPQVIELVEKYDPAVLWFDGEWIPEYTHEQGLEMYTLLREMKPEIIVNNRVDKGRRGMQGMNDDEGAYAGDFGTPEQEILEGQSSFDWEACMTMNDSWGYKASDSNWKSSETLIHNLVDISAKGGNYLLNIGPTAEGLFPEESVKRLKAMGDWMDVNAEVVHGSRSMKTYKDENGTYFLTDKSGESSYVVFTEWPGTTLHFDKWTPSYNSRAELLGFGELEYLVDDSGTLVSIPLSLQEESERPCQYAWAIKFTNP